MTAVYDDAGLGGGAGLAADTLEVVENLHCAARDLAEHAVLAVEPVALDEAHEELRSVGVGAGVGHRERERAIVPEVAVEFVLELAAPAQSIRTVT